MPAPPEPATARIYRFPARLGTGMIPRAATGVLPAPEAGKPCEAASGSGWYHDAAIRGETPARKT